MRLKGGAQALASYALQDAKDTTPGGHSLTNSPRHLAKVRLSVPGPLDRSIASFEWLYLSSRTTLADTIVGPASVANMSVNLPIGRSVLVTGQIRNLLNARYSDPASEEHLGPSIEQNGRTFRIGLRWAFWNPK